MRSEADIRIDNLHKKAKALLKQDMDEEEIIHELVKGEIDTGYANLIIENVKGDNRDRADAWKLTFMGASFIIGGIYINYFSYMISVNANASFFFLFWGIVVVGMLMLTRAFFLFRK
jgi:hypothetical protein